MLCIFESQRPKHLFLNNAKIFHQTNISILKLMSEMQSCFGDNDIWWNLYSDLILVKEGYAVRH